MPTMKLGTFILNNDLSNIKFSKHNIFHFVASFFIALFSSFWISYGIGQGWEIGDGFKPWYADYKYNPNQSKFVNWLRQNLLYSDGYSYQDAFIWDLGGALLGTAVRYLFFGGMILL